MGEDDDVLTVGPSRGLRVAGAAAFACVVAAGCFLLLRGHDSPSAHRTPAVTPSSGSASTPVPAPRTSTAGPAWPTRDGACGNTAYLPLVHAQPLDRTTGVWALVGDRLDTVDVDSGTARPAHLPPGTYASALATADDGTYALLSPCTSTLGAPVTVARWDTSGTPRTVARGPYGQLLSGGRHVWGVEWNAAGTTTWLDALDGSPRRRLPRDFAPVGAHGDLIVGTVSPPGRPQDEASLQVLDPATGRVVRRLGVETAVTVSRGLVLWTGPGCTRCRLHTYDVATGVATVTPATVPANGGLWAGVVSPDRRTVALLGPDTGPVPYDMGHPGYPNVITTLDLRTGAARTVPGVVLFAKSAPGLAWSADGRWLVITLDEGTRVRVLVWRPGLPAPLQSPARLTAQVAFAPGVATLG